MERRLAAIVAADVVGFSRLVRDNEDGALAAMASLRRELIEPLVAENRGRIVKLMGDGLLIEFHSAVAAVRCAVAWQENIVGRTQAVPISFRIGINLGDIVVEGDDILGDGVNIASRLEGLSRPGGICISDTVHEQVRDRLDIRFDDEGERQVKNIERLVRVWMWTTGATPHTADLREKRDRSDLLTLSVLPFRNLSGDPEQAYFTEGICEDVITGLSKNSALRVFSRTVGSGAPKGANSSAAAFVLDGSVRRSGGRTRVAARLTDVGSGDQIWAEQFDSDMKDLFELQDDIVASIVHGLGAADGAIEKSARQRSSERSSNVGSAYDWYLKGRQHFYKHGDVGIDEAEACYLKALHLDADFAPACSALAWLHFVRFKLFRTRTLAEIRSPAMRLALRALQLDRQDFRAHWVLGGIYLHDGEHALSIAEFDKALRINPNDANLLAWSAEPLTYAGFLGDAVERCDRAMRINPNCPDWYHWVKAFALFHQGRYDMALAELSRMSTPGYAGKLKAAVLAQLGDLQKASEEADAFMQILPGFRVAEWALTERYADPAELDRYMDGLRKAGFPE
jgi:adenylate cyclase